MKNRFFKYVEIDRKVIENFCLSHPQIRNYLDPTAPFYVRVGRKPYSTLIHTIICDNEENDAINIRLVMFANAVNNKINAKKVAKANQSAVHDALGDKKYELVKRITDDIMSKKLDLKKLVKCSEQQIYETLSVYPNINISIIKSFTLFGCFKQNVLCFEEKEFINGLKIFLNKKDITKEDLDNITKEYSGQLTLLTLCMFRINNERAGK